MLISWGLALEVLPQSLETAGENVLWYALLE